MLEELFNLKTIDIKDISILQCIGGYFYLTGNFEDSLKYYKIAEEVTNKSNRKNEAVYSSLGFVYYRCKEYDDSYKNFNQSIVINKDFPWGYTGLGIVCDKLDGKCGNPEDYYKIAIEKHNIILKKQPTNHLSLFGMGYNYFNLKKYDYAIKYFSEAIRIKPNFAYSYYDRAIANIKLLQEKSKDITDQEDIILDLVEAIIISPPFISYAAEDPDLDPIRDHKCYKCLIKRKKT